MRSVTNYGGREFSRRFALREMGELVTDKSQKDNCDINKVVARAMKTGVIELKNRAPLVGDFADAPDFRTVCDLTKKANDAFYELPAALRKRFGHDPVEFVDFCSNPKNKEELIRLGLANPDPVPEPEKIQKVEVVNATDRSDASDARGGGKA